MHKKQFFIKNRTNKDNFIIHKQKSCFLIQNIKNNENLIIRMLFAQKTRVSIQDVKSREFYDYK